MQNQEVALHIMQCCLKQLCENGSIRDRITTIFHQDFSRLKHQDFPAALRPEFYKLKNNLIAFTQQHSTSELAVSSDDIIAGVFALYTCLLCWLTREKTFLQTLSFTENYPSELSSAHS